MEKPNTEIRSICSIYPKAFVIHMNSHLVLLIILVMFPCLTRGSELSGMWLDGEAQLAKDLSKDDVERVIIQLILDGILVICLPLGVLCNYKYWASMQWSFWRNDTQLLPIHANTSLLDQLLHSYEALFCQHYYHRYAQKNIHIFSSV